MDDMRALHAEKNATEADEIAARQANALRLHCVGKLRLTDVNEIFLKMRGSS